MAQTHFTASEGSFVFESNIDFKDAQEAKY